ncbi:MAG TPA: TetR/AcrR family transcriptional regulator [Stellaceae bacterium]|nr:TetR/AcrR family transcriptional regulator [Stellaceae bacterium]
MRESNKAERRRRIQRATLEVLAEKGFDNATTREIAQRANVAVGTIFLYARDKVDLFLMSINDDLDQLTDAAFAELGDDQPLLDQIITFFRHRYAFWSRHPDLYRAATVGRASSYPPPESEGGGEAEMARGIGRRVQALQRLTQILERGVTNGRIRPGENIPALARILLDIYLIEMRFWLSSDEPQIDDGMAKLRYLVDVIIALVRP